MAAAHDPGTSEVGVTAAMRTTASTREFTDRAIDDATLERPRLAAVERHLPALQELPLAPAGHVEATASERRQSSVETRERIVEERLAVHRST